MKKISFLKLSLFLSSFVCVFFGESQTQTVTYNSDSLHLIQLSGVAVSEDSLEQLSYTTVYNRTQKRGVFADYYGFFTMVTLPGDTLLFSAYGHVSSSFIVPDSLKDDRYSIIHLMRKDTLELPQVNVYPWPSREEFARYFVNMQPYDDALRRAQRELSNESLAFAAARLGTDASISYGVYASQMQTKIYTQGQLPANNLLNPYSWAKLIQNWKEGKLARE